MVTGVLSVPDYIWPLMGTWHDPWVKGVDTYPTNLLPRCGARYGIVAQLPCKSFFTYTHDPLYIHIVYFVAFSR
jgi:hypothetical protein